MGKAYSTFLFVTISAATAAALAPAAAVADGQRSSFPGKTLSKNVCGEASFSSFSSSSHVRKKVR